MVVGCWCKLFVQVSICSYLTVKLLVKHSALLVSAIFDICLHTVIIIKDELNSNFQTKKLNSAWIHIQQLYSIKNHICWKLKQLAFRSQNLFTSPCLILFITSDLWDKSGMCILLATISINFNLIPWNRKLNMMTLTIVMINLKFRSITRTASPFNLEFLSTHVSDDYSPWALPNAVISWNKLATMWRLIKESSLLDAVTFC